MKYRLHPGYTPWYTNYTPTHQRHKLRLQIFASPRNTKAPPLHSTPSLTQTPGGRVPSSNKCLPRISRPASRMFRKSKPCSLRVKRRDAKRKVGRLSTVYKEMNIIPSDVQSLVFLPSRFTVVIVKVSNHAPNVKISPSSLFCFLHLLPTSLALAALSIVKPPATTNATLNTTSG